jgi:hypothetical protein
MKPTNAGFTYFVSTNFWELGINPEYSENLSHTKIDTSIYTGEPGLVYRTAWASVQDSLG